MIDSLRHDITARLHWLAKHFDPDNPQLELTTTTLSGV